MKSNAIFKFCILAFFMVGFGYPPVSAQKKGQKPPPPLSGHWSGVVTQDIRDPKTGGLQRIEYEMYLDLNQKGKEVTGTATFITRNLVEGKTYQATMSLRGKFKGGTLLEYEETGVLRADQVPNSEWCQKKAELIYRKLPDSASLEGLWSGFTASFGICAPGRMLLKKTPNRV